MPSRYPSRIVCLTEETTETLYLLGEGDRVVGVSGYTVRPPEARRKPRVSAFLHARYERIDALQPDLILGFSDLQATIAADLIKRGYPVAVFNQVEVDDCFGRLLGQARFEWRSVTHYSPVKAIRCRLSALSARPLPIAESAER